MNREILFRAKRKDNGEWIESLTLLPLGEYLYMFQTAWGEITYDLQHNITAILGGKKPFLVEVIPSTVGKYTGLTDKNGRKIFEGDIVRKRGRWTVENMIVAFAHGAFYCNKHPSENIFPQDMYSLYDSRIEIIGNVHNNSDLLKGLKE